MADPASSVAHAFETAPRPLHGHLSLLLPTIGIVIGIITLATLNYWQPVRGCFERRRPSTSAGCSFLRRFMPTVPTSRRRRGSNGCGLAAPAITNQADRGGGITCVSWPELVAERRCGTG
jgi:hypothetical protein